jgi:hypothetical protein
MRGAIPPFPSTSSWRGAQLKHRDSFIFTVCIVLGPPVNVCPHTFDVRLNLIHLDTSS